MKPKETEVSPRSQLESVNTLLYLIANESEGVNSERAYEAMALLARVREVLPAEAPTPVDPRLRLAVEALEYYNDAFSDDDKVAREALAAIGPLDKQNGGSND